MQKVKDTVNKARGWTQDDLIRNLNPILRGWTNYHRCSVSKRTFSRLESYILRTLWRWALNRHRNKGKHWVMERYWHRKGTRAHVFHTEERELLNVQNVSIIRHVKVRNTMNPYADRRYFELKRKSVKG